MNFEFITKKDGTSMLTRINDPEAFIIIPATWENHVVNEIGEDIIPMGSKTAVQNIILPNTIEKIGIKAFNDLRYLKTLILNEGLKEIADYGIFTVPDLAEIYIPESVTTFGTCAVGYFYEHGRSYKHRYFTLVCDKDSVAENYCKENEINYKTKIIMA